MRSVPHTDSAFHEVETLAGCEAVALKIFVGNAPHRAPGGSEHQLFNGNAPEANARDIRKIVVAFNEIGVQSQEVHKEQEIQNAENDCAHEHGRNQVAAKKSDH